MELTPFRVQIASAVLEDLRQRIVTTRWPDEVEGAEWAYGANLAYLQKRSQKAPAFKRGMNGSCG